MIDRFLVIAEANGLPAAIVLNKIELDRTIEESLARRFKTADYQLLATSVKEDEGLAALRDLLRGRHSVFTGASGAGKSSLLNALEPGLKLRVGAISEKWRTGKHTTTTAELVPIAGVGYVVDTPGGCGKWARGASIRTSWARAFPSSGPISINAASTIAATSPSRAAPCAPRRPRRSTPIV
jgi:ribosome biogenesis GTPase